MKLPVRSASIPNRAAAMVLLLAATSLSLTVGTTSPAEAREPSPPTGCSTSVDRRVKAIAKCTSGYGTYRVWARCNWSASTLYGAWKAPSRTGESVVFCVTSTHQAGIVMAHGIQKRDG
ncbi:hypothetical protein [Kribbella italica]|uniref:Uncharacterized protein n=1 Tax=Kribbella italica TaxID=1540520 RepID=A0A7W9JFL6_9ACTN|nr:hypothetical protein [Kribbella italica]MBB5841059.1 hypothetical protein [Kribbella italica]